MRFKIEFFNAALKKKPQVRERERDKFSKNLQHLTILIPLDHRLIGDFFITFKEGNNNKKKHTNCPPCSTQKKTFLLHEYNNYFSTTKIDVKLVAYQPHSKMTTRRDLWSSSSSSYHYYCSAS